MAEMDNGGRYTSNPYRMSRNPGSLPYSKLQSSNPNYPKHDINQYYDDDDDDEEDEDMVEVEVEQKYNRPINRVGNYDDGTDDETDEDEYGERHRKKRKLKSVMSSYEFAPRVAAPSTSRQVSKALDWTEHETFILLEFWGEKFVKKGKKSLRSEEWQEVAEEVFHESKIERTVAECRNRLDMLKNKYKKEKIKSDERGVASRWMHFKKMDSLMSFSTQRQSLSCGMDSGEYVFMNPKAYLDLANGMDELRDSPCDSESDGGDDDKDDDGASIRLLADSIDKFGEIYEKIEHGKRQQLQELEKMRMDFQRDLEAHKRQILERTETEIARIREQSGNEENHITAENI